MEAVEGPTLSNWATELGRRPTQMEIDALLGPLLHGLGALHDVGILHLAITPETIALRDGREPVLTHLLAGAGAGGSAQGTAFSSTLASSPYRAPELVARDAARLGPEATSTSSRA